MTATHAPQVHTPVTAAEIAHVFDDQPVRVDLRNYAIEDWATLLVFWLMVGSVILQFFTRYVLNDSLAWTEEIAISALVVVVFLGSSSCVRLSRHIQVDFIYRYLPHAVGRVLSTLIDAIRIAFLGYATWLVWDYATIISDERMTTVDLPKSIVFYAVIAAFALMTVRAIQVAVANYRRGYSVLERPAAFEEPEV